MRRINYINSVCRPLKSAIITLALLASTADPANAEKIVKFLTLNPDQNKIETYAAPIAAGTDSVFCGEYQLQRNVDYELNPISGRMTLLHQVDCDSLRFIIFRLPPWLAESYGNPVPQSSSSLNLELGSLSPTQPDRTRPQKFQLSGNKSFSFAVGRNGEGRFSQGLNIDFDALLAEDLQVQGSISDRIGSSSGIIGSGSTTLLSELDKYFFEIRGKRVFARGGDIKTTRSDNLLSKKIKGVYGGYGDSIFVASGGIGRPSGRFISQYVNGLDGNQGPYQLLTDEGRPAAVVPGSEKIYLDGQLLEAGTDKHYEIDYFSGRIIFSPGTLITARSRIEVDFEAAETVYEKVIIDGSTAIRDRSKRIALKAGFRRESDEKDRLRFGSYSAEETQILQSAGDNPGLARRDGAILSDSGAYDLTSDTLGNQYYLYVGEGNGQYRVSFSLVGDNQGDYRYIGDGIYEFNGSNKGNYSPIIILTLPQREDQFYADMQISPVAGSGLELQYEGILRDRNLLSTYNDEDNYAGMVSGRAGYTSQTITLQSSVRLRQDDYRPLRRLYNPDFSREWALPEIKPQGNELLIETINNIKLRGNQISWRAGYLRYSRNLESRLLDIRADLFQNTFITPRITYLSGNSKSIDDTSVSDGLFEKINPGLGLSPVRFLRISVDYDRELSKNRYAEIPEVEKYSRYRAMLLIRNTILSVSRRIDFRGDNYGYRGPQQDKIELISEENFGRVSLKITGSYQDQKRLDSERSDLKQRLYQTSLDYHPAGGWLSLSAVYHQNQQSARATGYRYIPVEAGEGDYRLEEGQYLPDPDGDFIRVREELGAATSITVGEKSHNLLLYPGRVPAFKSIKNILSQISLRLQTQIIEELPGQDRHRLTWLLPWSSQSNLNYLRRQKREGYSVLLFPAFNFYVVNFAYSHNFEELLGGESLHRGRKEYRTEIKNQISRTVRSFFGWTHYRNYERGIGFASLMLSGNKYLTGMYITQGYFQVSPRLEYLRLADKYSDGLGSGFLVSLQSIYRQPGRGEIRLNTELRSINEKRDFAQSDYLVTDGNRFGKSALFQININYELGKSMRLTANLRESIFEDRPAEFNGRGELVAQF